MNCLAGLSLGDVKPGSSQLRTGKNPDEASSSMAATTDNGVMKKDDCYTYWGRIL